jgi:hypothetical protein
MVATIDQAGLSRYYSAISWHCLMAGYGTFRDDARLVPPGADIQRADIARIDDFSHPLRAEFRGTRYFPHKDLP